MLKTTTYLFPLMLSLITFSGLAQKDLLIQKLYELPDIAFEEIENVSDFEATFVLSVKQPLDHSDPSKGYFHQKVYLTHRGFDRPTVLVTEGYNCAKVYVYEMTTLLGGNQVEVEHRFFGESMPDSLDYAFLNLKQATADLHHVKELLGTLYEKEWVSTGISKGGATTIFYKYFYPEDVAVGVPYVAPINTSFEEARIYHFFDTIGSSSCRKDITDFQIQLLKNRAKILPLLDLYVYGTGNHFTYKRLDEAFELAVLEFPFSFWQYGKDCGKIPKASTPLEEQIKYLLEVSNVTFFSDEEIARLTSHYYQSAQEMGYYGYEVKPFKNYLKALSTEQNPHAAFLPEEMQVAFDGTLLMEVNKWLEKDGNDLIYIYGGIDTWSASAVPPNDSVNSAWFFLSGKHHGNARYKNLTLDEKKRFNMELERRVKIKLN